MEPILSIGKQPDCFHKPAGVSGTELLTPLSRRVPIKLKKKSNKYYKDMVSFWGKLWSMDSIKKTKG